MKKSKQIFMGALFLLLNGATSNAQTFEWAESFGGTGSENVNSVTTDAAGNVYTVGTFQGIVDFDPDTTTSHQLISNGGSDCFIQKLDASGNFVWAKTFGGSSYDRAVSVSIDASGNVYTIGYFQHTVDFDPDTTTSQHFTSNGNFDCFVQKLDASGNFVWAKTFGGTGWDRAISVSTDMTGHIYTVGYFLNTVDFDPDTTTLNLTSNGDVDVFIQKLDTSGNFIWAKAFGGTGIDRAASVSTDASGNIYTVGEFTGTVDFDPGTGTQNLTSNGINDAFVQKLDTSGNFVWAKTFGGIGNDAINSVSADVSGSVYTVGYFEDTVDFDLGAGVYNLSSNGSKDCFVQKLDTSGNFVWAKTFGGTGSDYAHSVSTDALGHIYTVGEFLSTVDFDPETGTQNLTSNGSSDVFIQKLDTSGNFVWAKTFGGTGGDRGRSVTTDASYNIYTVGDFQDTVDFDPETGVHNLTSNGNSDVFVQKLNQCNPNNGATSVSGLTITADLAGATYQWINCSDSSAIAGETGQSFTATANGDYAVIVTDGSCTDTSACVTINSVGIEENTLSFSMHPNPATGTVEIQSDTKIDKIEIINNLGQKVGEFKQSQFDISELKNGIHFVKVTTEIGTTTKRLIKQ